jgi:hypothetical protein
MWYLIEILKYFFVVQDYFIVKKNNNNNLINYETRVKTEEQTNLELVLVL